MLTFCIVATFKTFTNQCFNFCSGFVKKYDKCHIVLDIKYDKCHIASAVYSLICKVSMSMNCKIEKGHLLSYNPVERLIFIVGNYGSGKTEISVNLAGELNRIGCKVTIADIDLVNPYFRSREAKEKLEDEGIDVVIPKGELRYADLPILLPQIKGLLNDRSRDFIIFDVGGDDVGAKVLSSLYGALNSLPYSLLQVVNTKRPFTSTVDGCIAMKEKIEASSRMKVTALVGNTHLMEYTDELIIKEGVDILFEFSAKSSIPVAFVSVMHSFATEDLLKFIDVPVLKLRRRMSPPWILNSGLNMVVA
jgi:hypothetical protein